MRSLSFVLPAIFLLAAMEVRADPTEERCSISGLCELCSEAELETEPACKRYGRRQEFTCTYIDLALARDSAAEQGDDANTSASAVTERQRRLRGAEAAGDGGPTGRRAEAIATPARDAAGFLFAPDERRELRVEYRSCDSTAHDDLVAVLRFLVREIARLIVIAPARRSLPRALPPPPSHVSSSFSSAPRRPRLRLALISATVYFDRAPVRGATPRGVLRGRRRARHGRHPAAPLQVSGACRRALGSTARVTCSRSCHRPVLRRRESCALFSGASAASTPQSPRSRLLCVSVGRRSAVIHHSQRRRGCRHRFPSRP